MIQYTLVTAFLLATVFLYIKIAQRYEIVDIPGSRSSHSQITIRGAGIIFPLSAILSLMFSDQHLYPLMFGLLLISTVSFVDDLRNLNPALRLVAQLLSIAAMLYAANVYGLWPLWLIVLLCIFIAGVINVFNFMDGINGITGIYSLVALFSLLYINYAIGGLVNNVFFIYPATACAIFLYFNLRAKTRCFAGDVGSISIAFWLCFLLVLFIFKFQTYKYIFLIAVYAVDAGLTMAKRILLKENILQPHRKHLYQLLVNNGKFKHINVALAYGAIQLFLNILVVNTSWPFSAYILVTVLPLVLLYILLQHRFKAHVVLHHQ